MNGIIENQSEERQFNQADALRFSELEMPDGLKPAGILIIDLHPEAKPSLLPAGFDRPLQSTKAER